jgi:uncharacterized protein
MCRISRLILAGIMFGLGAVLPAKAASALEGWAAINRGDYVALARRTIPLAQRGDPRAQAMLGFMYANGHGVPQSYDVAVDWYLKAAEQGEPTAQYLLGLAYDKGFGVSPNVIFAYKWLNLAAAHAPARNRETFLRMRDAVATKMTLSQRELGQQLSIDFIPQRPR